MPSYVPPHLRGGGGATRPPPQNDEPSRREHSSRVYSDRDAGRGSMQRTPSTNSMQHGSNASFGDHQRPMEAVWCSWQPSERVQGLSDEQIADVRERLNISVKVPDGQPKAAAPIESFQEMMLHENINKDIARHKYQQPTPIQCQGIPIALSGRDILGCAETGSGKTASFSIPMVQHCLNQPPLRPGDGPMGLVLAPTRELAQQIEKEVNMDPCTHRVLQRSRAALRSKRSASPEVLEQPSLSVAYRCTSRDRASDREWR